MNFAFTMRRAEYFIPAGVLLKCFLETSDRELYDRLMAGAPPGSGHAAFLAERAELLLQHAAKGGLRTRWVGGIEGRRQKGGWGHRARDTRRSWRRGRSCCCSMQPREGYAQGGGRATGAGRALDWVLDGQGPLWPTPFVRTKNVFL